MRTRFPDLEDNRPTWYIARDTPRKHRRDKNVKYKTIGCNYYPKFFKDECRYTGWVERLYGPEYTDPAKLYLHQRQAADTDALNKVRRIFTWGIALTLIGVIVRIVDK